MQPLGRTSPLKRIELHPHEAVGLVYHRPILVVVALAEASDIYKKKHVEWKELKSWINECGRKLEMSAQRGLSFV